MTTGLRRPSVAIVDHHPITAAGIAAQLAEHGFAVAAVAATVEGPAAAGDAVVCDLRRRAAAATRRRSRRCRSPR